MKTTRTTILALTTLLILLAPRAVHATTWTVEKDGSADFTVIQDAIDAAQSGDTILIGPGRFDDLRVDTSILNGVAAAAVVWVKTSGLEIVGSGKHETIIGPATYQASFEGVDTIGILFDSGAASQVRDVGIENLRFELAVYGPAVVEDCRIARAALRDEFAVFVGFCDGAVIRRVEFIDTGGLTTVTGAKNLLVEDCYFEDNTYRSVAVHMGNGAQDCVVRNCTIVGGAGGIQYSGTGTIEDCSIQGTARTGISLVGGSQVVARRCHVGVTVDGVFVASGRLELFDSVIEGGTSNTLASAGEIYARGCHIFNAGAGSMYKFASNAGVLNDLRYNWWGTSDPEQIASWIVDPVGTTIWLPFNDMSIPTESSSISGLKGRFRGSRAVKN